jgi:two-component system, OmpR family, alkaline phosphatase synthesis response regulator PhoP
MESNQLTLDIEGGESIVLPKYGKKPLKTREPSILMIEDNEILLELFHYKFKSLPYFFTTCNNGWEGLKTAKTLNPDIILLDLMLPGLPGLSVLKSIREASFAIQPKIIILSSKNREKDIEDGFELGR